LLPLLFKFIQLSVAALTQSRDSLARATEGAATATRLVSHSAEGSCVLSLFAEINAKFVAASAAAAEVSASDQSLKSVTRAMRSILKR
jgi:hypothetical protein